MSRECGAASTPGAREGTAIIGGGAPTSAWRGGTSARRGCMSTGAGRVSASPGSIGASLGAGRLASTLASAARARASADVWPRGSFSATLVSVFVCLRPTVEIMTLRRTPLMNEDRVIGNAKNVGGRVEEGFGTTRPPYAAEGG